MKGIFRAIVLAVVCLAVASCGSPKLVSYGETQDGLYFVIKHTAGNSVNPANYTDTITIPRGTNGVVWFDKVKAQNENLGHFTFQGGFIDYRQGKWVDVRLLEYSTDHKAHFQYNANGKYSCSGQK